MAEDRARTPLWRKSSRSGNNANCVETATNVAGLALVRDSKDATGPVLEFTASDWRAFTLALKPGGCLD